MYHCTYAVSHPIAFVHNTCLDIIRALEIVLALYTTALTPRRTHTHTPNTTMQPPSAIRSRQTASGHATAMCRPPAGIIGITINSNNDDNNDDNNDNNNNRKNTHYYQHIYTQTHHMCIIGISKCPWHGGFECPGYGQVDKFQLGAMYIYIYINL